jgi:hypothetical protein
MRREAFAATVLMALIVGSIGMLLQRWVTDGEIGTWSVRVLLLMLIMRSVLQRRTWGRSWLRTGLRSTYRWIPQVTHSAEPSSGRSS